MDHHEPWRRWVYSELERQPQLQVVGEASDGLEAVKKAHELKPDIILLDIDLPNLSGLEAASRIAHSSPDSKIVFLTTQSDPDFLNHALSNGATGYVLKEDFDTDLLPAIEAALRSERFVSRRLHP